MNPPWPQICPSQGDGDHGDRRLPRDSPFVGALRHAPQGEATAGHGDKAAEKMWISAATMVNYELVKSTFF